MSKDDSTVQKTLWSETLIEILMVALKGNNPDDVIKDILKELREKGFKSHYISKKVEKELGIEGVRRIKAITK
ncbi:MAG: hypothetical protein V3U02_03040 [Calditrichia bacterium]